MRERARKNQFFSVFKGSQISGGKKGGREIKKCWGEEAGMRLRVGRLRAGEGLVGGGGLNG